MMKMVGEPLENWKVEEGEEAGQSQELRVGPSPGVSEPHRPCKASQPPEPRFQLLHDYLDRRGPCGRAVSPPSLVFPRSQGGRERATWPPYAHSSALRSPLSQTGLWVGSPPCVFRQGVSPPLGTLSPWPLGLTHALG